MHIGGGEDSLPSVRRGRRGWAAACLLHQLGAGSVVTIPSLPTTFPWLGLARLPGRARRLAAREQGHESFAKSVSRSFVRLRLTTRRLTTVTVPRPNPNPRSPPPREENTQQKKPETPGDPRASPTLSSLLGPAPARGARPDRRRPGKEHPAISIGGRVQQGVRGATQSRRLALVGHNV